MTTPHTETPFSLDVVACPNCGAVLPEIEPVERAGTTTCGWFKEPDDPNNFWRVFCACGNREVEDFKMTVRAVLERPGEKGSGFGRAVVALIDGVSCV